MTDCLVTNDLCKSYRNFKALHRLNMHIPKGAIYGFVGKNGAGKTTLIRQICGLQNPLPGATAFTVSKIRTLRSGKCGNGWELWWKRRPFIRI